MSEEERKGAIERIRTLYGVHRSEDYQKAFDVIIAALSAEPCEDAISRYAALDIVDSYSESQSNVEDVTQDIISEIVVLPSVNPQEPSDISNDGTLTVNVEDGRKISRVLVCGANHWGGLYYPDEQEPKTGHWILTIEDWNKWTCSECGFSERTDIHVTLGYHFCPKCGAKMESEEQA